MEVPMRVFALKMARPDKRAPMICWFDNLAAAQRQAVVLLNLTLSDFGAAERVLATRGYKRALDVVKELTGEDRIEVDVIDAQITTDQASILKIETMPRRVLVWERAAPELQALFASAPRTKIIPGSTGVSRYYQRRAAAAAGAFKRGVVKQSDDL